MEKFGSHYKSEFIGDLWIFEYDYSTDTGMVKGSDVDWKSYAVIEGEALWLVLAEDERAWLKSSWEAATKHLSNPGIYLGLDTEFVEDKPKCYLTNDYCPICLKQKREFADHHCEAKVDGGSDDYFNILRICCTCHTIIHNGSVEDRIPRQYAAREHQLMYFGIDFFALDSLLEEDSHESRYRLERSPSLRWLVAQYKSWIEASRGEAKAGREKLSRVIKDRARLEYQYYRDVAMDRRFTDDWLRRLEKLELMDRNGWPPHS